MPPLGVLPAIPFFQLLHSQKIKDTLRENDVAIQVIFGKCFGISQAVRFGNLFTGHLQITKPVILLGTLQMQKVHRKVRAALFGISIGKPHPCLLCPFNFWSHEVWSFGESASRAASIKSSFSSQFQPGGGGISFRWICSISSGVMVAAVIK